MAVVTDTRQPNSDPHPSLSEAVSVSRFWRLVDIREKDECWTWNGHLDDDGYGIYVYRGKRYGAHELALSFTTGEKRLKGLDTCHSCDNPTCVNPSHLRFDTRLSNVREMHERGRNATPKRKLSDGDIRLIRMRRSMGARQKDLAEDFRVSDGLISEIVRGIYRPSAGGPIQKRKGRLNG